MFTRHQFSRAGLAAALALACMFAIPAQGALVGGGGATGAIGGAMGGSMGGAIGGSAGVGFPGGSTGGGALSGGLGGSASGALSGSRIQRGIDTSGNAEGRANGAIERREENRGRLIDATDGAAAPTPGVAARAVDSTPARIMGSQADRLSQPQPQGTADDAARTESARGPNGKAAAGGQGGGTVTNRGASANGGVSAQGSAGR